MYFIMLSLFLFPIGSIIYAIYSYHKTFSVVVSMFGAIFFSIIDLLLAFDVFIIIFFHSFITAYIGFPVAIEFITWLFIASCLLYLRHANVAD